MPLARRWGRDGDPYRASAVVNPKGRVVIDTAQLNPPKRTVVRRALGGLVRKLKSRSKRKK